MQTLTVTKDNEAMATKALSSCSLFRALQPDQIGQLLKAAELVSYEPDEVIVRQGEPSDSFLVLADGIAVVTADRGDGEVQLGEIPLPSSLGEVSLLLREPRTATVTARGSVKALKFSAKAFEAMFKKIPEFGTALAEGLAFRLQRLSDRIEIPGAVGPQPPPAEVLDMLPMELIQRHRIMPLRVDGNVLSLGFVDAPSTQVITAVQGLLPSLEVRPAGVGVPS
jgi:CRP-like cAMP-binding protein